MKGSWTSIITIILFACNNTDKTNKDFSYYDYSEIPTKDYDPEYPLVNFSYDQNKVEADLKLPFLPNGITDLIVDSADGHLVVSFDREDVLSCPLNGQIERHFHGDEKGVNDTIYLDYYQNCEGLDNVKPVSTELRLYYQITNAIAYKKAIFIPREKEHK